MTEQKKAARAKRDKHLKVHVFPEEREVIERQANAAGLSVSRYLRDVGQGYEITGIVDYEQVRELARINGDLGRLGGLLKMWLSDDARTSDIRPSTIRRVLERVERSQDELGTVMTRVVMPRARR